MTDVFISYASEDHERARKLASSLEAEGWSVWWDRRVIAGQAFDQVIEHALESAKSIVVLWSKYSISSEWVKNEATVASERGVLVPALIDEVKLPLEFRRRQTANLIDWDGDTSAEGFTALCEGIAAKTGPPVAPSEPTAPQRRGFKWQRRLAAGTTAVVVAAAGFGAYRVWGPAAPNESRTGLNVARPGRVVEVSQSESNGIDNPATLNLGALHQLTLRQNEEYYFRLPGAARSLTIVQDMRLRARSSANLLQGDLSVLNEDGTVVQHGVIQFNELNWGFRKTASFSLPRAARYGFKLLNRSGTADVWLAVQQPAGSSVFFPFFGEVVPQPLFLEQSASGVLNSDEEAYYVTRLPPGDYRMILDLANSKRENTNISGYLARLEADGGKEERIVTFSEISVSTRQIAPFSVTRDAPLIMRLRNSYSGVDYALKIAQKQR